MTKYSEEVKEVLASLCQYQDISLTFSEAKDALEDIENNISEDFWIKLDGYEFRIISKYSIDQIWTDSLIDQIKECYKLDNIPSFIEIDWEETANNCKVDGMGHHFSHYDHSERESEGFHYFLTHA